MNSDCVLTHFSEDLLVVRNMMGDSANVFSTYTLLWLACASMHICSFASAIQFVSLFRFILRQLGLPVLREEDLAFL
jgi:hypothetical protein